MATIKKQLTQTFKQPNIAESYGPYASILEAHEALSEDQLNVIGMTVGIEDSITHTIEEYWYQGGTEQENLVKKQSPKVEANPEDPEGEYPSAIELLTLKIDEQVYMIPESAKPDAQLSGTSTNSVQNKVVKAALDGKAPSSNILKTALANDVKNSLDKADTAVQSSEKGVVNGVATLGSDGKVPETQLPSYVDDVLEYANLSSFPQTGESGKIYVALDTNKTYRDLGQSDVFSLDHAATRAAREHGNEAQMILKPLQQGRITGIFNLLGPVAAIIIMSSQAGHTDADGILGTADDAVAALGVVLEAKDKSCQHLGIHVGQLVGPHAPDGVAGAC